MIDAGVIPRLNKFSKAIIKKEQTVSSHRHDKMYEILFFLTGRGELSVDGNNVEVFPNQCVVIEPGEVHSIQKVLDDVELVFFGIEK